MAIVLEIGLTPEEIRVLQEFRRLAADSLPLATLLAIRHPVDRGEAPMVSLVGKGYLARSGDEFSLTDRARAFLAIDAKP